MNRKMLMNLQGMTFTEQEARDYYGGRFEATELVWVTFDEEGEVVEGKSGDCEVRDMVEEYRAEATEDEQRAQADYDLWAETIRS